MKFTLTKVEEMDEYDFNKNPTNFGEENPGCQSADYDGGELKYD
mgnify:FL=1